MNGESEVKSDDRCSGRRAATALDSTVAKKYQVVHSHRLRRLRTSTILINVKCHSFFDPPGSSRETLAQTAYDDPIQRARLGVPAMSVRVDFSALPTPPPLIPHPRHINMLQQDLIATTAITITSLGKTQTSPFSI